MTPTFSSKPAIDLLFRVMDARGMAVAGATVVAAMDDYEDEPMPAVWSPEHRGFGYYNSVGRWVGINEREIAAYRVDYARLFAAMLMPFERQGSAKPTALIADHLWDVGTVRILGAKAAVPVWFGRRLGDPQVWARFTDLIERRPAGEMRLVLTSTRGDRLAEAPSRRCALVSVADVLETPDRLAISRRVLPARVFPGHVQRRHPIDHSEDYGIVWLRDETFTFRGDKQRRLLEQLFEAYWSGRPALRVSAVLSEAGFSDKTNSLSKALSGRGDWQKFIRRSEGNCWIEP